MTLILHIETATPVCSVALSENGAMLQLRETSEKNSHSAVITLFIDEVMKTTGKDYNQLDAVAVSMGPGSYTGLRIGVSTAKGICYAIDKPLIAISTLQAMAAGVKKSNSSLGFESLFCPMIDARRMEVYNALYLSDLSVYRGIRADVITNESFHDELEKFKVHFFGNGAEKCRPLLESHPNAVFPEDFSVSSAHMISLAEEKYSHKEFEDVVYFEPYYLKDFIPGVARVKGLTTDD